MLFLLFLSVRWKRRMNVSNHNAGRGILRRSEAWISNTIDWEYSSNLSLMSISSYVEYETGNIYTILMIFGCLSLFLTM